VSAHGAGRDRRLVFRTNVDDEVVAGPDHPIRVAQNVTTGEPAPYILIRDELEALIGRSAFYDLVELAEESDGPDGRRLGVWSDGQFFELGRLPNEPDEGECASG